MLMRGHGEREIRGRREADPSILQQREKKLRQQKNSLEAELAWVDRELDEVVTLQQEIAAAEHEG